MRKIWGLVEVTEIAQLESARVIRNSCREFMTRDNQEILPDQQLSWWAMLPAGQRLFLFSVARAYVGYGFIREEDGKSWLSGGLAPEWRGRGLGTMLFRLLIAAADGPCKLEVLESNPRAKRVYDGLGFREVSRGYGLITMEK